MIVAPLPADELQRLAALRRYQILDTAPEAEFDDLTRLAAIICETPTALISLVDVDRQWFKSRIGLAAPETPRDVAFCSHAILQPEVLEVPDAGLDPRFQDNPLVTVDPRIRFYAGAPLQTPDGHSLGTICVIDYTPRRLEPHQREALNILGREVIRLMELRLLNRDLEAQVERALQREVTRRKALFEHAIAGIVVIGPDFEVVEANRSFAEMLGYTLEEVYALKPWDWDANFTTKEALLANWPEQPAAYELFETRWRRKDGALIDVAISSNPISEGSAPLFYSICHDITERKRAEAEVRRLNAELEERVAERTRELRSSEAQLRDLFDNASDLLQSVAVDGKLLFVNKAWRDALGYSDEEIANLNIFDVIHPDSREHCKVHFEELLQGAPELKMDTTFVTRDGREIQVEGRVNVKREEGVAVATRGIFRDVTSERRMRLLDKARIGVLERLAASSALSEILPLLASHVDRFYPGHPVSILLLDSVGRLHNGATHGLPQFYNDAIEGLQIGPTVGSCGAAAATGKRYIAADIRTDRNWAPFREVATRAGLAACWSQPILGEDGRVLGTVALYATRPEYPDAAAMRMLDEVSRLTALTLQRSEAERALRELNQNLEYIVAARTAALRESERFTRASLDALSAQIAVVDEQGRILATNRAWQETAGAGETARRSMDGVNYLAVCERGARDGLPDAQLAATLLRAMLAGDRKEGSFEYRCPGEDAEQWFLCRMTLFPGDGPVRVAISHEDITARKQAELSALRSKIQFEDLFEYAPDAMVIADAKGVIQMANEQALKLFEFEREQLIGQKVRVLLPDSSADLLSVADDFAEKGEHPRIFGIGDAKLYGKKQGGRTFPAEVTVRPIEMDGNRCFAASIRDNTQRELADKLSLRAQRMESIGALAGGVAHDLNNALAPIMMATSLLREQYPADEDLIETIQVSAKQGADMVRQLLTFAKGVEGERVIVHPEQLHREMEKIIKSAFPKNIQLRSLRLENTNCVLGDPTQLHQVLLNLCVNARDAMPDGGLLTLELQNVEIDSTFASAVSDARPGCYVMWRVTDTGQGIPPQILDRIFEPFFSTKGPEKGTGLGLSTVSGIVRSHGGFIQVYSTPGRGSRFAVYLPAHSEVDGPVVAPAAPRESGFRGSGETILVVDDEAAVRTVTRTVLTALNFVVVTAVDGTDGLIQAADRRGELRAVITDLHMPDMDGLGFVRALKRIAPEVGVIVASGHLDDSEAAEFKRLGVDVILDKPFTQEKLEHALRVTLEGAHSQSNSGLASPPNAAPVAD